MNAEKIIKAIGGRKVVIEMTGLTKGRISQWVVDNSIPVPWLKFFGAKFPDLDWEELLNGRRTRKTRRVAVRRSDERI